MLWAAIATYLWSKPVWVQAVFVGLCSGLFVAALAGDWVEGGLGAVGLLFAGCSLVSGGLFYIARNAVPRPSASPETEASSQPIWALVLFPLLWLVGIAAFVRTLLEQGFAVAILLILPLMLVGPVALDGARALVGRLRTTAN